MKTLTKLTLGIAAAILFGAAQVMAQTNIVFYSFNTNGVPTGTKLQTNAFVTTANIGSSISLFTNVNTAGGLETLNILSSVSGGGNTHGFPSGNSISQNGWNGNASYFQFTLDSTGYQGLILAWAGNRSSTGPTNLVLEYSSTGVGGTFTTFNTLLGITALLNYTTTQNMSSVTAIDNNPNVVFRLRGTDAGAASGTLKIDNFSVEATVIPEPSTVLLVGVGLVSLLALRRRRS